MAQLGSGPFPMHQLEKWKSGQAGMRFGLPGVPIHGIGSKGPGSGGKGSGK